MSRVLRGVLSLGLLGLLAGVLDASAVVDRLAGMDPAWALAALGLASLQFVASAARWRRTAHALGVPLSRRRALADYYLAGLANQLLPGGVLGDAARAARHARSSGRAGPAVRAVVLERASGQFALLLVTAGLLWATPSGRRLIERWTLPAGETGDLGIAALASGLVLGLTALALALTRWGWMQTLFRETRAALLSPRHAPVQLGLSLAVVAALVGAFVCAGRALGVEVASPELAVLAPLVLLSMLIPISIGGWGVRESAAAVVFALAGHAPEAGVAVSVAYGGVALLAALPGALVPLTRARRQEAAA